MKYLIVLSLFVVVGCSVLDMAQFEKPKVKLQEIQLVKANLQTIDLMFTVLVDNPNDFPISMKALNYELEMNNNKVATQNINTPTDVAAKAKSSVKLPLSLNYSQIFSSIGGFLKAQESTYRIKGSAKFGFITLPFSETGQIKIENGQLTHTKN